MAQDDGISRKDEIGSFMKITSKNIMSWGIFSIQGWIQPMINLAQAFGEV